MSYVIIVGGSAHEPKYFRKNADPVTDPSDATIFPDHDKAEAERLQPELLAASKSSIVPFGPEWQWFRTKQCAACQ